MVDAPNQVWTSEQKWRHTLERGVDGEPHVGHSARCHDRRRSINLDEVERIRMPIDGQNDHLRRISIAKINAVSYYRIPIPSQITNARATRATAEREIRFRPGIS
jgi:hypothetical protein